MRPIPWLFSLIIVLVGALAHAGPQNGSCGKDLCTDVAPSQLPQIEAYLRTLGLDWSFEVDGCDFRAQTVIYALAREKGIRGAVFTVNESISMTSRFIPWHPELSWGHHTAAVILVGGVEYVLDFALFDQAVPKAKWLDRLFPGYRPSTIDTEVKFAADLLDSEFEADALARAQAQAPRLDFLSLAPPKNELDEVASELWDFAFSKKHVSDQGTFYGDTFYLRDVFPDWATAERALLQSTRCAAGQLPRTSDCTAYVALQGQTCYFKFIVNPSASPRMEPALGDELLCF